MHRAAYTRVGGIAARPQGLRPTALPQLPHLRSMYVPMVSAPAACIHIYIYICMLARSGRDRAVRAAEVRWRTGPAASPRSLSHLSVTKVTEPRWTLASSVTR
jgi:hypothetical protein